MPHNESLLSGVRIVELGHVLAGPFTTSLCADFGAEVIKVEDPCHGDMMRTMGPTKDGVKLWWKATGRNKKSITLNLKHPRGLALCRQLIAKADAVVENFRPGVLQKLGLGHEDMRAVNPRLVIVSISGYGITGPESHKPGYGRIAEAFSGLMQLTGEAEGAPLTPGFSIADVTTGTMAAFGLAMALFNRDRGGPPATIDLGLHEIVMRSDYPWNTASGYYKMPEATLATRRNGWFHTGDRGYLDADGYLFFADRKKDAIRRRGENISAFEVEQAMVGHPAVADAAVFAVASALGEDEVAAAVVRAQDMAVTEADLVVHCQRNMAYFMVPRYIRFVDDLPRNPMHKVLKYQLQEEAKANPGSYWDREQAGIVLQR